MVQHKNVAAIETLLERVALRGQETLDGLPLELVGHQLHLDHLDVHHLERDRLQHLQLRAARLQAEIVDARHVHGQHQRVEREALDPGAEAVGVVQAVGVDAVDLDAVALLLLEGDLLGVGGGAEAGVDGLGARPVVALQVEEVAGVRLDEEAAPGQLALQVFGLRGSTVVVGARFDEETSFLERFFSFFMNLHRHSGYKNGNI